MSADKSTLPAVTRPCARCPWRKANQGKRDKLGFYTKANLRRLWNELRRGGTPQSCHLTDPNHPKHVEAGAKPGATPKECSGSVIVVLREVRKMADAYGRIEDPRPYLRANRRGLTREGIFYWVVQRIEFAGVRFVGGPPLPEVDEDDPEIGLPA